METNTDLASYGEQEKARRLVALGAPSGRLGRWALQALESSWREAGQAGRENATAERWEIVERWGAWPLSDALKATCSKAEWESLARRTGTQSIVFIGDYPNKTQDVLLATSLGKAVACIGAPGEGLVEHAKLLSAISNAQRAQRPLALAAWREHCPAHQWMSKQWRGWHRRLGGVESLLWCIRPCPDLTESSATETDTPYEGATTGPERSTDSSADASSMVSSALLKKRATGGQPLDPLLAEALSHEDAQHALGEALDFLWTLNPEWRHERAALRSEGEAEQMSLRGTLGRTRVELRLCAAGEPELLELQGPLGALRAWPEKGTLSAKRVPAKRSSSTQSGTPSDSDPGSEKDGAASQPNRFIPLAGKATSEETTSETTSKPAAEVHDAAVEWSHAGADWNHQGDFPVSTPLKAMEAFFHDFFVRADEFGLTAPALSRSPATKERSPVSPGALESPVDVSIANTTAGQAQKIAPLDQTLSAAPSFANSSSELRRAGELAALRRRSFMRCHWMDRPREEAIWAPRNPKERSEVLPAHLERNTPSSARERFRAARAVARPWAGGVRGLASNDPVRGEAPTIEAPESHQTLLTPTPQDQH